MITDHMISSATPLSQLALGTAQLGMAYGIANVSGKPTDRQAKALIAQAWHEGIRCFDTAQAYGDSETVLGDCLEVTSSRERPRIITKLHPAAHLHALADIEGRVRSSVERLRIPSLWGLLLHREEFLDQWHNTLGDTLRLLKKKGLVQHLGVSVYHPERALQALDYPDLDLIQVALNIFDRRMWRSGILAHAHRIGKTIFIRSIYLQGLALMAPEDVPAQIPRAFEAVNSLARFCRQRGLTRREFALGYARHLAPHACFVIGAETVPQVVQNIAVFRQPGPAVQFVEEWTREWEEDIEPLINPSLWPA